MPDARLNLAALRLRCLPGHRPDSEKRDSLTRRELLGAVGTAAAVLSPSVRALGDSIQGPYKLTHGNGRAVFEYAGQERWTIDAADYTGNPQLTVDESDRTVSIILTGARYPGTDLPADFTCELKAGVAGWKMKFQHALGGFKGQAPFERWLTGQASLESPVKLKADVCSLGGEAPVRLDGRAFAEFHASGRFNFRGASLASVEGDSPLTSDRVELSVLREGDSSVFEKPSRGRTLLTLHREERPWTLRPIVDDLPVGEISCYSDPFDTLSFEISPNGRAPSVAMLAESGPDRSEIRYRPHSKLLAHDDSPFELRLRNARYAVSFESEGPRTALMGDFDRPSWMYAEGCSVLVGDGPNALPFEITGRSGKTESLTCTPALLGFMAPLAGAVVEPSAVPSGETISFEPEMAGQVRIKDGISIKEGVGLQLSRVKMNPLFAHIGIMAPGRMRVVRPEDMLALQFGFINLRFQTGAGGPVLTRSNPAQAAYLVVVFPPQYISEEAGYEQAGTPPLYPFMPAKTRMAGESRLAFLVPNTVASIPYTIDGLLDWEKLVPSVVPAAEPPKAPIRLPTGAITIPGASAGYMATEIYDDTVIRLRSTAAKMQTRSRNFSQTFAIESPKLFALSPQIIPATQKVPTPSKFIKADTHVSATAGLTIAALLQTKEIREPHPFETSIEAPWRLILSPHDLSAWAHESDVEKVTHGNRTELWHTRLGTLRNGRVDEDDDYYRVLRAVWSPDYRKPTSASDPTSGSPQNPFRMSLLVRNRHEIVRQTSDWIENTDANGNKVVPRGVPARQFMMSPLGAFMDLHGRWESTKQVNLSEWVHRAQMGRDNFVRVVEDGYLMPFGHRAVRVTITERKLVTLGPERFAMLMQRQYIEIKEPEKTYPGPQMRDSGLRLPFSRVLIKTKRTPDMADPGLDPQFFPIVAGAEYHFSMEATDKSGRESEFSMPLMFVLKKRAQEMATQAINQYNANPSTRRMARMQGQKVGFAQASIPGDTLLDTAAIIYKADPLAAPDPNRVSFYPCMETADVTIPAARAIADASAGISVEYPEVYYLSGFGGANAEGQVYLRLTGGSYMDLSYHTGGKGDRAGGMATPNVRITGLSRRVGVVGGPILGVGGANRALPGVAQRGINPWKFNPADFFGESAKLLGFLALKDIIPEKMGDDGRNAPKLTTKDEETKVTTTLEWKPDLNKPVLPAPLDKLFKPDDSLVVNGKYRDCLEIKCELVVHLGPAEPTYDILGKANNFTMELFDCIQIKFDYIQFTAKSGAGVDVKPKFGKNAIEFIGPLSFVNKLKDLLPGGSKDADRGLPATREGGKDLFEYFIDPSPSGIRAGFTINVPSVSVGVFSLQNIGVGAEIDIPFTGDPLLLTFNFCSRDNPMLLSVWIFGGGGWFNLTVGLDGIVSFEASFQFGVVASLSFGIASGGVSVMAGVTYNYESVEIEVDGKKSDSAGNKFHEDRSKLTGYFEANGWVDVLGLISASLELYLGLEYINQGGQSELWGTARITFRIEILFLEFSVSAQVEKRFAGSGPSNRALPRAGTRAAITSAMGGVNFEEIYSEPEWNEYCLAFA